MTTPTAAKPTKTPDMFGTSEEGCWTVHVGGMNDTSWGPFPTRTAAIEFIGEVDNDRMFGVNMTDLPNFFNV